MPPNARRQRRERQVMSTVSRRPPRQAATLDMSIATDRGTAF